MSEEMMTGEMPKYVCHKTVHALKIERVVAAPITNAFLLVFADKRYAAKTVTAEWVEHKHAQAGGYYVVYEDGYDSYSPAEAFESGYTLIEG